jgi:hypothetical protein
MHAGGSPHSRVPTSHGFPAGVQDAPGEHALHVPATHTFPAAASHTVASGARPVSVHTGAPLEQEIAAAVAHGFVEVQAAPVTHAVQRPPAPLQTPASVPEEHAAPAGR